MAKRAPGRMKQILPVDEGDGTLERRLNGHRDGPVHE